MKIQAIIEYTVVEQIPFMTNFREDVKVTTLVNRVKVTENRDDIHKETRTRKKEDYLYIFILFYVEP